VGPPGDRRIDVAIRNHAKPRFLNRICGKAVIESSPRKRKAEGFGYVPGKGAAVPTLLPPSNCMPETR
jgi:hypothetical protein